MSLRSEDSFLDLIDRYFPNTHAHMSLGRGDDCALLRTPEQICLTTDMFIEGVHFRRSYFEPQDIGYKALAVNLSDIAGMGARPLGFALNLMATGQEDAKFCQGLVSGLAELAQRHDLPLVGGDLSRGPALALTITIWGRARRRFLLRRNSRPGDLLFCLGALGLARCGLFVLEQGKEALCRRFPEAVQAHLRPQIRLRQARRLSGCDQVRGLMDVSDGLIQDLPRFVGPDLGVEVLMGEEEVHPEVSRFVTEFSDLSGVQQSLVGGEDYALLGAVTPDAKQSLEQQFPEVLWLGKVVQCPGIYLDGECLGLEGFDHFKAGQPK